MDKITKLFMLVVTAACCLSACHLFEGDPEMDAVAVYFNESNVTVFEGGLGSVTLRVEPADALENRIVEYEISNDEIAAIYRADKRGCVFYGRKAGSTILMALIGNAEAKMVINVLEN